MNAEDTSAVRRILETCCKVAEVAEAYTATTFTGNRNGKRVSVEIRDMGADCPKPMIRYSCRVVQADGKVASGSDMATAPEAVSVVHWFELD
jgi:hypothetical protein